VIPLTREKNRSVLARVQPLTLESRSESGPQSRSCCRSLAPSGDSDEVADISDLTTVDRSHPTPARARSGPDSPLHGSRIKKRPTGGPNCDARLLEQRVGVPTKLLLAATAGSCRPQRVETIHGHTQRIRRVAAAIGFAGRTRHRAGGTADGLAKLLFGIEADRRAIDAVLTPDA
jgi:hypothetical protein